MTTYAYEAGRRARQAVPRACAWLENVRPAALLAPAIVIQWLAVAALALTVRHNGWLYYQGGDQLWYYTSGWLLRHGILAYPLVGPLWPALLAPLSLLGGPTFVSALPAIVLLNVVVLLPIALLCVFGIAQRIGGRIFAYWATLLWIATPYIGIKFTDAGYHQRYTELTLPGSFGLTALADFPSMVAVLVAVYLALRTLDQPERVSSIACGLAAGTAFAIKPSNSIFLTGLVLAFAYRRRFTQAAYVVAGLTPALLLLVLWKYRGLGYLPLFHAEGAAKLALPAHQQLVAIANPLTKYVHLDWHQLQANLDQIKEHFWSRRVVEWLVIAGLIGLARRSFTALLLVGGWFVAFVLVKGTFVYASVNDASVFRIMMPSFPAFVLMLASLVFLFPGRHRATVVPPPGAWGGNRRRLAVLAAAGAVFALFPLVLVAAASPLHGPRPRAYEAVGLLRAVDPSLRPSVTVAGQRVHLSWRPSQPAAARVFYRIWRSGAPTGGATCTPIPHGVDDCELAMDDLGAPASASFTDAPGPGRWTYRLVLAANWLDSALYGDVVAVGPPVTVLVG